MVLKEIKGLSLRGIVKELYSNETYRKFCKISDKIPSIGTLSYRTSRMDFNALIQRDIERVNANLKSTYFFSLEDVYYVPHRHYEQAVGLKLLVHNLVAFANISVGLPNNRKLETVTL